MAFSNSVSSLSRISSRPRADQLSNLIRAITSKILQIAGPVVTLRVSYQTRGDSQSKLATPLAGVSTAIREAAGQVLNPEV